ncbi:hypothetical protein OV208_32405 [Corallococcus sp. bb12-1]|uniref:hypothetical protein n=1 Tax=Corallococcus sp. bb12-1 TaxID=2996784 RepID=UPI00226D42C2|nr:hypothetical protein [Corallococcus sp. bb12-1]MCY1046060.1 hypothetical protein [Corallococcus sp. bb12-1]
MGAQAVPDGEAPEILLVRESRGPLPPGFRAYLLEAESPDVNVPDAYVMPPGLLALAEGDVVRVEPSQGRVSALYRKESLSNSLLVTERCDNYCLMCSQPPR